MNLYSKSKKKRIVFVYGLLVSVLMLFLVCLSGNTNARVQNHPADVKRSCMNDIEKDQLISELLEENKMLKLENESLMKKISRTC